MTEIYDYFRLLFANIGIPHCPICGKEVRRISVDQITEKIMAYPAGSKILLLAPIVRGRKGEYVKQLESLKKSGYLRVKIDGIVYTLDEEINLDKNVKHTISVVVDRLVVKEGMSRRLTDSVEAALKLADGLVAVDCEGEETLFSTRYACPDCDVSMPELTPRMFSFNAPYGACPNCMGLGFRSEVDPDKVVKYPELSLRAGAIRVSGWMLMDFGKMAEMQFRALSEKYGFSLDTPWKDLPERIRHIILYGTGGETLSLRWESKRMSAQYESRFEGIVNNLNRRYNETQSDAVKADIERLMTSYPCEVCHGKRLKKEVLAVTVGGKNIAELSEMPVVDLAPFMANLSLNRREATIAEPIVKEIRERLRFLVDVGLGYLTLARSAGTLSGGESQRIRLATQIGSGLTGVLYILDEPSIGLHQRDNRKLLNTLLRLRDLGNTLIVVEHDDETIRAADHIVDIGPGAGVNGGYLVAEGTVEEIMACPDSLTGDYLAGRKSVPLPDRRRPQDGRFLTVRGARQNNLKGIDVSFPVGLMTAVTGVSGSGKSSLVNGIVSPALANRLNNATQTEGKYDAIEGSEYFDKIINIDQSPIGRTPRSNPATYTGVFTPIRELFAMTQDAKARGYKAGRFSFNVAGGRCENCSGDGIIKIEMHFLPDVYVPCEVCDGKRYNHETLEVRYKGKNIYDVLEMTVDDACVFFENVPQIYSKIKCLKDVGLGYIKLGQPSTTLSGGEAQRVKLATELSKRSTGKTLYILDEPTTGLHVHDVAKLIAILQRLTDGGNTVIVIEHNLDVVKVADYIVDLGPEGGDGGGTLVAAGTPEEIAACEQSFTGAYLKPLLEG